jgi:ammonia channel protein AmtB
MTVRQKNHLSMAHQVMTVIGVPVLIYLVGDIYIDFKKVRDKSIQHESSIEQVKKDVDRHDVQLSQIMQKVY